MLNVLQLDFNKYPPEQLYQVAQQVRTMLGDEVQLLVIPTDVHFFQDLTEEQLYYLKQIIEKELEARHASKEKE